MLFRSQTPDTGTAHLNAANAMLNSNNRGAAKLACPATVLPNLSYNPPGGGEPIVVGAPRAAGRGGRGPAGPPAKESWFAEGGKVFDNLYMLTTKENSAWALTTSDGIILIDTLFGYAAQDAIVDGLNRKSTRLNSSH